MRRLITVRIAVFQHLVRSLGDGDGDRNFSSGLPAKEEAIVSVGGNISHGHNLISVLTPLGRAVAS